MLQKGYVKLDMFVDCFVAHADSALWRYVNTLGNFPIACCGVVFDNSTYVVISSDTHG